MPESPNHEAMPQAHDLASASPEKPADPDATRSAVEQLSPDKKEWIGPYKLLEPIGQGGMGVVYMAEQEQPVRRRVALKLIKPGMDSAQVIARFRAEQQALALMDHQNIAKVYDAGTTTAGRPYFVMELVHGVPITKYCDDNKLTPRERLELFIPVCRAVQHAHQKGIIHRDLKPSNVLVCLYDGKPVAKVIDFGVAKAMEQPLTDGTMYTHFGQVIGTLEYMSPEQAEMSQLGIDTRSDIYSLGVMLYELLTGSTPLQKQRVKKAALDEILKLIREEEPQPPSSRLSSSTETLPAISQQRRMEPAQLTKLMRGELDWIVMKSLEKDRTRRYGSADGMAQDIERYLADEPVEACPPSATYRLRKYAHKHRVLLTTAAAFALLLIAGTTVSVWQAIRATNAESDATLAKSKADKDRDDAINARNDLGKASDKLRRVLYASDMTLIRVAWDANQPRRALELLKRHRPKADEIDLRGFEWYYWKRRLQSETRQVRLESFEPKEKPYYYRPPPSISDSGRYCAETPTDGKSTYRFLAWELATGKRVMAVPSKIGVRFDGQPGFSMPVIAFSRDDRLVSVTWQNVPLKANKEKSARSTDVFSVETNKLLYTLSERVFFHPDGKRLLHVRATEDGGNLKIVWRDSATGVETKVVPVEMPGSRHFVKFSNDFKRFLTRTSDEKQKLIHGFQVFDTETAKLIRQWELPNPIPSAPVQFTRDNKHLVVGPWEKGLPTTDGFGKPSEAYVNYWEIESAKLLWTHTLPPTDMRYKLTFSSNDRQILATYSGGVGYSASAHLIDTETGKQKVLLTAFDRMKDAPHTFPARTNPHSLSPDGQVLIVEKMGVGFSVIATSLNKTLAEVKFLTGSFQSHFTPDGNQLVAVDEFGIVRTWDARAWQRAASLAAPKLGQRPLRAFHPFSSSYALLQHDGKRIVAIAEDLKDEKTFEQFMKIFDVPGARNVRTIGSINGRARVYVEQPGSRILLVVSDEAGREVRLIDPDNGHDRVIWKKAEYDPINLDTAIFLPGRPFAVVSVTEKRRSKKFMEVPRHRPTLVDINAGKSIPSWWDNITDLTDFMASDDGYTVALIRGRPDSNERRHVQVFETDSGRLRLDIADIGFDVHNLALTSNGNGLALLGQGQQGTVIQLRDVSTGIVRFNIVNPEFKGGGMIDFSPDGRRLCITQHMEPASVHIWDLDGNELCKMVTNHAIESPPIFSKDGHRLLAVRAEWESFPPEEMLEVIDATPLPGDEPAPRAALNKEGTR